MRDNLEEDRVAVGRNPSVAEPKVVADEVLQQVSARAARDAVDRIVRAHHAADVRVAHTAAKRRRVELRKVLRRNHSIEREPVRPAPCLEVVPRKVLARRDDLAEWFRRHAALQRGDELVHVLRDAERVLAWCFLPAAPARVAERVDVRRPEVKPSPPSVVERAGLSADYGPDGVHELVVEGSACEDGLGKRCRGAEWLTGLGEIVTWAGTQAVLPPQSERPYRTLMQRLLTSASFHQL